jgi:HTH-type transcriptional regulator/antitoxin HigA
MILNDRQHRITRLWKGKFERALQGLRTNERPVAVHPLLWQAQQDAYQSQIEEMQEDIQTYQALKSGQVRQFALADWRDLGKALVQARIAQGLSQQELAERLGVEVQAVLRAEDEGYTSSTWAHLLEVARVLGLGVLGEVRLG